MLIQLKDKIHKDDVWKAHLKLERECLRVTDKGTLARNPFKLSVESLFMKTDESKGSIKLITPTYSTSEEVYRFLCALYQIMSLELEDEYLWPQSHLDSVNQEECQARGMNYYFSFNESLFEKLYEVQAAKLDYLVFKKRLYSKVADYYQMYQEVFTYFLSNLSEESNQMNDFFENQETKMRLLTMEGTDMIHISLPLNPCEIVGIALEDLQFIQLFLLFLLDEAIREPQKQILKVPSSDQVRQVLNLMQQLNEEFSLGLERALEKKYQQLANLSHNCSELINNHLSSSNPKEVLLTLAKEYKAQMKNKAYALAGFEMLELSTQILIKEAIKHGIRVEVLDDADNFIVLKKDYKKNGFNKRRKPL